MSTRPQHLAHLAARFRESLGRAGPEPSAEAGLLTLLNPGERLLYGAMSTPDRRHAVRCAEAVAAAIPGAPPRVVVASALHDVGKTGAGLGTAGRVLATVTGWFVGDGGRHRWAQRPGLRGRIGRYLRHPELGAELLCEVGSDPLTVAWAREHHLPPGERTIDAIVGAALERADRA